MFLCLRLVIASLLIGTAAYKLQAQENVVLDTYTCAEFLDDAKEPADGARLLRSLMMIAWAGGYAAAYQEGSPRADPTAIQLIAATLGDACRKSPDQKVVGVIADAVAQFAKALALNPENQQAADGAKQTETAIAALRSPTPVSPVPDTTIEPAVGVLSRTRAAQPLSVAEERALVPKESFKECDNCPEMVVVPAGSFNMGSPETEKARHDSEGPQHRVTFAKPFAVGRFAVTFAEWDTCVAGGGCKGRLRPSDEGWGRGRRPVINVSWDYAQAYVAWLSQRTGKTYRLLTEAEREYVTRAGTTTPFWWGSSISPSQANYDGNFTYGGGPKGEYREKTLSVDWFASNPWGLYQVHGNVSEWVEDCMTDSYRSAPADGSAWTSGDCRYRGHRGGWWAGPPNYLRAARRDWRLGGWSGGSRIVGFRVARMLMP